MTLMIQVNADNPVWDIFDTPCKDEWEQESGEVVYNKRENWEYSPLIGRNANLVH